MILNEKNRRIVSAIETYRKAYWMEQDAQLTKEKRYKPLVSVNHITSGSEQAYYIVSMYDTWIDFDRPAHFFLAKDMVPNSLFKHQVLELALQELLNFAKVTLMSEQLFKS